MYNLKIASVAGTVNAGVYALLEMQLNGVSLTETLNGEIVWVMAAMALVAVYAVMLEKDNYHN